MTYASIGYRNHRGGKFGAIAQLAAQQHGAVSRSQLRDHGLTDAVIGNSVAAGYLHPVFRGAFAVGHPRIGESGRMMAAVLACGRGTTVSHQTAAALLGLRDRPPTVVEVIAPGESGRGIDGIRRYRVSRPTTEEIGHCARIPCTSPARTLVDLAGILGERSLRRIVERAAVLQALDFAATEQAIARVRRRGAPLLRAILAEWHTGHLSKKNDGGIPGPLRSDLEARLLALIGAAALPTPLCNQVIVADGRRIEVDFLWPEDRLVIETDGRSFHDNSLAFERDRLRDRALHVAGYRVVRFTHNQIRGEADAVVAAIRRLLA